MIKKLEAKVKLLEESINNQVEYIGQLRNKLSEMERNLIALQGAYQVTKELLDSELPDEDIVEETKTE